MSDFIDDISTLDGELGDIAMPNDTEEYAPVKVSTGQRTPPAGHYTLQLPTEIKVGAWPANEKGPGSIELKLDPITVVNPDGPGDGLEIRYFSVSTRLIGGLNASSATDLLQRAGITTLPRSAAEWQDAARALEGQTVEGVYCDWETRVKGDVDADAVRDFLKTQKIMVTDKRARKVVIRGMKQYPKVDGVPQSKLTFQDGPGGHELILYANLKPTSRGFGFTADEAKAV